MSEDKPGSSSTASMVLAIVAIVLILFCAVGTLGVGALFFLRMEADVATSAPLEVDKPIAPESHEASGESAP